MMSSFFKKYPIVFYTAEFILSVSALPFILLLPKEYIYWNTSGVIGYTVGLFVTFLLSGLLLACSGKRPIIPMIIEGLLFAVIGGGLPYFMHLVFNQLFLQNLYRVMNICCVLQITLLGMAHLLIVIRTSRYFSLKNALREGMAIATACLMLAAAILPFSGDFFRTYFRKYTFLSEPCVFVGPDDTYAVMFATSGPGTAKLLLTVDGEEKEYLDIVGGTLTYDSQVHRIDVPKDELERGTYVLTSRQTMDCTGTVYRMGKTIVSKSYAFRPYSGNGDVSFLCISDNQGTSKPTQKAIKKAAEKYQYDFVMLLGDQSEAYNESEEDFVNSLLTVAGLASRGEKPVYYTVGNHEYRGMMSASLFKGMPTPSEKGEYYYTFTMGDAYFTVLNFSNEDSDEHERYAGIAYYSDYKETEYEWLKEEFEKKEYETYRYNVMISHIPVIDNYSSEATEYMCEEIIDLLEDNNVGYVVSGHSHEEPKEFSVEERTFKNLHAGSYYNNKAAFRNSIVHLKDGKYRYEIYDSNE